MREWWECRITVLLWDDVTRSRLTPQAFFMAGRCFVEPRLRNGELHEAKELMHLDVMFHCVQQHAIGSFSVSVADGTLSARHHWDKWPNACPGQVSGTRTAKTA